MATTATYEAAGMTCGHGVAAVTGELDTATARVTNDNDPSPIQGSGRPGCRETSHCALGGIRTPNLLIRSQMLYPLSYERRLAGSV